MKFRIFAALAAVFIMTAPLAAQNVTGQKVDPPAAATLPTINPPTQPNQPPVLIAPQGAGTEGPKSNNTEHQRPTKMTQNVVVVVPRTERVVERHYTRTRTVVRGSSAKKALTAEQLNAILAAQFAAQNAKTASIPAPVTGATIILGSVDERAKENGMWNPLTVTWAVLGLLLAFSIGHWLWGRYVNNNSLADNNRDRSSAYNSENKQNTWFRERTDKNEHTLESKPLEALLAESAANEVRYEAAARVAEARAEVEHARLVERRRRWAERDDYDYEPRRGSGRVVVAEHPAPAPAPAPIYYTSINNYGGGGGGQTRVTANRHTAHGGGTGAGDGAGQLSKSATGDRLTGRERLVRNAIA